MTWILVITLSSSYAFYIPGYESKEACDAAKIAYDRSVNWRRAADCVPGPGKTK